MYCESGGRLFLVDIYVTAAGVSQRAMMAGLRSLCFYFSLLEFF